MHPTYRTEASPFGALGCGGGGGMVGSLGAGESVLEGMIGDSETDGVIAPVASAAFFCRCFLAS